MNGYGGTKMEETKFRCQECDFETTDPYEAAEHEGPYKKNRFRIKHRMDVINFPKALVGILTLDRKGNKMIFRKILDGPFVNAAKKFLEESE